MLKIRNLAKTKPPISFMILAWDCPFNIILSLQHNVIFIQEIIKYLVGLV